MSQLGDRIRLFVVGDSFESTLINSLVYNLNTIQDHFLFDMCSEPLKNPVVPMENGQYDEDQVDLEVMPAARRRFPGEFPILFTNIPFTDNRTASFDHEGALFSTHAWEKEYSNVSKERLAAFHLVDALLARRVTTEVHNSPALRECPSDSCDSPEQRILSMVRAEYCPDCRLVIRRALNAGTLSIGEFSALHRMLDWIAERKRAFVIMPFSDEMDHLYNNHIRTALTQAGWTVERVDENVQPAEITSLIREEISRARLVVGDLTGRNPNVFYELGYAHALGIPGILLIQDLAEAPFDIRQWRLIVYSPKDLDRLESDLRRAATVF